MKFGVFDIEGGHFGVGDGDALGICIGVEFAAHLETGRGGGGRDQIDDDLIADQRFGAPVLRYEREQTVLDLVPLAGPRGQVMRLNGDADLFGQTLQLAAGRDSRWSRRRRR